MMYPGAMRTETFLGRFLRGRRPLSLGGLALTAALGGCSSTPGHPTVHVGPDSPAAIAHPSAEVPTAPSTLQRAVAATRGPVRLVLAPGRYRLAPSAHTDPTCGNCPDAAETVPATVGLHVRGSGMVIEGSHPDSVVIETNAGYGILFDDCADCVLRGVTITGGTRDADGRATSGAVVVRDGRVTIERCYIRDNIGDSAAVAAVVVGIAGVVGREGSDIRLRDCVIERNSWDGVALYRGARAEITDNVIDGVEKATGGAVGGGRGVGIGMTWDARAVVARNLVRRYWKGIGVFVDAGAEVRHNVIEDILTWGLAYWGPAGSRPSAVMEENAVYITGACGASIERVAEDGAAPGRLTGNVFIRTNQDPRYDRGEPYCVQRPIARTAVPAGFEIAGNVVYESRQPGSEPLEPEVDPAALGPAIAPLLQRMRSQPATAGSRFVREMEAAARAASTRPAAPAHIRPAPDRAAGLIILVRHAETPHEPGGDPALTGAGVQRADRLAALLHDAGIETIHTTDYRRTRATASPIATALGLEPVVYDGRALEAVAARLARAGGRHLVVGHSNTTPQLVRLLGGDPGPDIRDDEHDRVYVVVLEGGSSGATRTVLLRY
jgi:2,3-bisphosphoglycerate-dependent phosphoglycerate mutase